MTKKELVFTILLIIMAIGSLIYSLLLPTRGNIALSPGLFPGVVSFLLIILNSYYLIVSISKSGKNLVNLYTGEKGNREGERSLTVIMSLFIGYLILLHYFHFIASTIIFLLAAMFFLYKRFHWKIPMISITAVFAIYYLFRYLLNVRLP
jgi:putative tricarboxylic transport membrane protein